MDRTKFIARKSTAGNQKQATKHLPTNAVRKTAQDV